LSPASAQDSGGDALLKSHALKRSGQAYLLAAESDFQKRLNAARVAAREVNYFIGQRELGERTIKEQRALVQELTERWTLLNDQLRQGLPPAEHNQLAAESNSISGRINLLRGEESDIREKLRDLDKELPRRKSTFIQGVLDLRTLADATKSEYERLSKDAEITKALGELSAKSKTPFKLGPSRVFLDNMKQLEKLEKTVLTEQIEMRERNGVYEVDVTFNRKETVPMIFDTGASIVTISSDLASRIGLKPTGNDPVIRLHVADGSEIFAKQMTIPSMRVGKFTLEDVVCAVMPPNKTDAPLLLGGSFLSHFTHKVDGGRLILTRIDAGNGPDRSTSPAGKSRTSGKRSPRQGSGSAASNSRSGASGDNP
jgi:aspartyl protease family protein